MKTILKYVVPVLMIVDLLYIAFGKNASYIHTGLFLLLSFVCVFLFDSNGNENAGVFTKK